MDYNHGFFVGKSKFADLSYKILFLIFIVIGAAGDMSAVWTFFRCNDTCFSFPEYDWFDDSLPKC